MCSSRVRGIVVILSLDLRYFLFGVKGLIDPLSYYPSAVAIELLSFLEGILHGLLFSFCLMEDNFRKLVLGCLLLLAWFR